MTIYRIILLLLVLVVGRPAVAKTADSSMPWWLENPKKESTVSTALQHQLGVAYHYAEMGGNVEAKQHGGHLELALRKALLTSVTRFEGRQSETAIPLFDAQTTLEQQKMRQIFRYGLTRRMEAAAGVLWTLKDTQKYLDDRLVYYAGLRFTAWEQADLMVKMGIFYGYSDTAYMNDRISGTQLYADFQDVADDASDTVYLSQLLRWQLTEQMSFEEEATYLHFVDDSAYYTGTLKLSFEFKVTKQLAITTAYRINYDQNRFTDALATYLAARRAAGKRAGTIETTDTLLSVGIKFNF